MNRLFAYLFFLLLLFPFSLPAQNSDSTIIRSIYTYALEQGKGYDWLRELTTNIGPRLSGSAGAEKAVQWAKAAMEQEKNGTVYLQEVMVPHWIRNDKEELAVISKGKKTPLRICSLGGSIPTPVNGLRTKVIEVKSFEELAQLGTEKVKGKIVFFNVPMNQRHISTMTAYGEAGKYRWAGAMNAAKYGAIGSITRSLTLALDDNPHTGAMGYNDTITKIPACAISTIGAESLSKILKENPEAEVVLFMNCETLTDKKSYNVIAEIKGTEFPEEIIVVGGHLDAWDTGQGAHDDGSGCVQSMEVLRIFRDLAIKPKRTVRVVLFMNEENGLKGAKKYAQASKESGENHIAAIESDAGGFTPHGFSSESIDSTKLTKLLNWKPLFQPYGLYDWDKDGGGADIGQLKDEGTLLIGLRPDTQRYFDYHHTEIDTFDKINKRELHLGAAAMASLIYLLAEYGVK
ncbi:MAG: M20/M25/M40 family metallo-hydrolase [Bacteroidetes bacterium]|nr:M20/M25/M40 family metallo-hydrolase [Bacteroidota bacterium]